ncbi:MAG: DUF302 domain-containing protein [Deltaproteobacteria bacterium]|nr:DUF302 domain-containing protein [Deltaproteobacteria bacterium]
MNRSEIRKTLDLSFDDALARVPDALATEGFGILTRIDVRETLKKKIDVDFRPYTILGACNPPLAHQALSAELEVGLMLPCNVIVYAEGERRTTVVAIDPMATIAASHPALQPIAQAVHDKLARALSRL